MRTYKQIQLTKVQSILTLVAHGVSCVTGYDYPVSDMIYSLSSTEFSKSKEPNYIAIREMGTECGNKANCIERCKMLGYPIVIAKIEKDKVCDYNMTIMFTQNRDYTKMEQEFNLL